MDRSKDLADQARSLIDRLNVRQAMISNQLRAISNDTTSTLKKSKSVSFLVNDDQSNMRVLKVNFFSKLIRFFYLKIGIG